MGGKQILDGMIVAAKAIHFMAVSKERAMFIKLDMTKAYDRVQWSFSPKKSFGFWVQSRMDQLGDKL